MATKNSVNIEVLGKHSLQPRHSIYVLKVLNKMLVVGVTEKGIFNLAEINNTDNVNCLEQGNGASLLGVNQEGVAPENSGFLSVLSKYLGSTVTKIKEGKH